MRVLLIDPAGTQRYVTHNAGLAFLSGALLARGHDVRVLDLNNYDCSNNEAAEYAKAFDPHWVGASVKTALVSSAEKTMQAITAKCPKVRTIAGGPHISVLKDSYLSQQNVYEFGLAGEGEFAFPDLIEGKNSREIPGLVYHENGAWQNNAIDFISDLDGLPRPTYKTWHRIDRSLFPYLMVHSRGCPYGCGFCSVPRINGRRFRKRSPEGVVEELRAARKEYVFRDFEFIDDNLTLDVNHAKKVCEALIRADLRVGWYANNGIRADRLDAELASLMKRSGCKGVAVGIESADNEILKAINKSETVEEMTRGIQLLQQAGITVGGHFIFGLPGDTLEKVRKSIAFKNKVGLDYAYFNQLVPYPGTEVGEWASKHGRILVDNITDSCHFGQNYEILMETPEFPKADRERVLIMLEIDHRDGLLNFQEFKTFFADKKACKALVIRSGRMDPYGQIKSLLPKNSSIDVLVSKGVKLTDSNISHVFEYPKPGLMRLSGLGKKLKKNLLKTYDVVFYINTLQIALSFANIATLARNCGKKVFEYQPGQQLREIQHGKYPTAKIYSRAS